ncbi:glycosyltransferase family 2 protein [Flavobacterium sp.]|uniref:glycosyltransferase family 2 protein n=1 Tax=Flavobacterium sp. TaxID=239 RepID=UPI002B4AEA8A|nr:glycosyltransferase family 2 protein [Flavobacterium sp.]HLF51220.1 glycosyltransferase family 2 protein [Flavobacterium sp.]
MNLFVVIVTYNPKKWINECFRSLQNSTIPLKTIVVDNCSTDGSQVIIKECFPEVDFIASGKNLGFGKANNIGIKKAYDAGADYVFLLNQDAWIEEKTLEKLIEVTKLNPQYGIISPIHLNGAGTKLDKNFSNYIKQNDDLFFDALQHKFLKSIYEVPFINAAAWMLPRKTLENIGGFDPIFHHYAEDENYCQRVLFHGLKIGVVPEAYIFHDREFRKPTVVNDIKDKLVLKERYLKSKWANINVEVREEIKTNNKDLLKLIVKLFLKLEFKKANLYRGELTLLNKIVPEIERSRELNSKKGKHYL